MFVETDRLPLTLPKQPAVVQDDRRRRIWQFIVGLGWSLVVALAVSGATGYSLAIVFPGLLLLALGSSALLVVWSVAWYARPGARRGHYNVALLLIVTSLVGLFLGSMRWLVLASIARRAISTEPVPASVYVYASILCLAVIGVSLPIVLGLLDSVVWMLVWMVRQPRLQRHVHPRRRAM